MQNLFILNNNGEVLIEKHWSGKVRRAACDVFWEQTASREEVPPCISTPKYYFVHAQRYGLVFLTALEAEVPPLFVLEAQNRFIEVLLLYFDNDLSETVLREQFSTVYQLLDEMVDGGVPSTIEPNQLTALVPPPTVAKRLLEGVTGKVFVGDSSVLSSPFPWRAGDLSYLNNEITVDTIEKMDVIVGPNENLIKCDVLGEIVCNCRLSGMPDLTLTFNRPSLIDDYTLHRCVRISKFQNERVISFLPPDGKFKLFTFRVRGVTQLPLYVRPNLVFSPGLCKVTIVVGPKFIKSEAVEGVSISIPAPPGATSVTLSSPVGEVKTDPMTKTTTWHIGQLSHERKDRIQLEGSITLPPDAMAEERPTLTVNFSIRNFQASGLAVDKLSFKSISYKPFKNIRCVTKAGVYQVRC